MLLPFALGCLPLPAPDFRRPAALVVFSGEAPVGLTARVCTWSTRHALLEGCDNLTVGVPAVDGVGMAEWSVFPLVLGAESPLWADLFVACDGATPRAETLRLPDLQVKWDASVDLAVDQPPVHWGGRPGHDVDDAEVATAAAAICAGSMKVIPS